MKIARRIVQLILFTIFICCLFRGWIYRSTVTYEPLQERKNYLATNEKFINYLEQQQLNSKEVSVEQIIKIGLSATSESLQFTTSKTHNNPNKLIVTKRANCIGYARFFATACNYILGKYALDDVWTATPYKGQLLFLGVNIHPYFKSAFFKDHDFVIVRNKNTGETFAVDPSMNDYLHIDFVTLSLE